MSEKKFSKEQAIRFGWDRMKNNLGFFIVYLIIVFGIQFFFNIFSQLFVIKIPLLSIVFSIGSLIVSLIVALFYVKIGLRLYDNEKIGSLDFLSFSVSLLIKFFAGYLLCFLISTIGLIVWILLVEFTFLKQQLLISFLGILVFFIVGMYLVIKYQFAVYLIVDKGNAVIDAFNESARITEGQKFNLFLLVLLYAVVIIIGALALGVGLLIAIPIVMVAQAYVYKKLSIQTVTQADILVPNTPSSADNPFQSPS